MRSRAPSRGALLPVMLVTSSMLSILLSITIWTDYQPMGGIGTGERMTLPFPHASSLRGRDAPDLVAKGF